MDVGTDYSPLTLQERATINAMEAAGVPTEQTIMGHTVSITNQQGEGPMERLQEGAGEGVLGIANVFGIAQGAETATEVAANTPGAVDEYGAGAVGTTATGVTREMGESAAQGFAENPIRSVGSFAGELVVGAGAGKVAGSVGRAVSGRIRTVGGDYVEAGDLTNKGTRDYYEGRGQNKEDRFPGVENPEKYRNDPAAAVRDQAERYTPAPGEDFFRQHAVSSNPSKSDRRYVLT